MSTFSYDFMQDTISQIVLAERRWSWKLTDNETCIEICWETPSKNKCYFELDRDNFLSGISAMAENFDANEYFSLWLNSIGRNGFPATEEELLKDARAIKMELIQLDKILQIRDRCRDCAYLVEDDNGQWVCDDCERRCENIPDDECSANQEW